MRNSSFASRRSAVRTLAGLPMSDRFLLAEVVFRLIAARLSVSLLPFHLLKRRLGQHMAESPRDDDPSHRELLRRVRWSLGAVSRRAPWRCMCLERSIAGKMMLRSRHKASSEGERQQRREQQTNTSMPSPIDCDLPTGAARAADRPPDCSDQLERISACTQLVRRADPECGWRRGPRRSSCFTRSTTLSHQKQQSAATSAG
jgi:hypothetical protein